MTFSIACLGNISTADDDQEFNSNIKSSNNRARSIDTADASDLQSHCPNLLIKIPRMQWDLLRQPTIGLSNGGNNVCYINAALQCLASTPPFAEWLLSLALIDRTTTCE